MCMCVCVFVCFDLIKIGVSGLSDSHGRIMKVIFIIGASEVMAYSLWAMQS